MNESNGKKQVAALWILGVLVVILIAVIVGLFITQAKIKNQEVASKDAKIAQMEQELAQVKNEFQENKNKKQNEYIEITEELRPGEVLYVTNVEKNTDNTYTLQGVIYSIYTLTYNEMEQIKSIGTFNLAGKTYNVKKNEKNIWELYDGNTDFPKYQILNLNTGGYYLSRLTTLSNVYKITPIKRQITVSRDTICEYNYNEATAKEEFDNFQPREPNVESDFPIPFYSFKFENGKCVSIYAEHGQ